MSRCPLCESPAIDDDDVTDSIDETLPDDFDSDTDYPDIVTIKRELESEFDITLTVSQTKRHILSMAERIRRNKQLEIGGER
jgi:hypothetical protein